MTTLRALAREYSNLVVASDFSILAAHTIRQPKEFIFREPDYKLTNAEQAMLRKFLLRRTKREPVAYIVGEKEFFGLSFLVTHDTLVPRPETEFLVEEAIQSLRHEPAKPFVADLGTGSGNIIISVAHGLGINDDKNRISFFATDISHDALHVARRNAIRHNMTNCITFLQGDLLGPIPRTAYSDAERILILANLPYLSRELYDTAMDDVRLYEPKSALVSDDDGLSHYIRLFVNIFDRKSEDMKTLHVTGLLEISPEQETRIINELHKIFPNSHYRFMNDLSGRKRIFRFDIE
jgi:release factor glutamine methyltransferase